MHVSSVAGAPERATPRVVEADLSVELERVAGQLERASKAARASARGSHKRLGAAVVTQILELIAPELSVLREASTDAESAPE